MDNEVLLSNIKELCKKNNIAISYLEKLMGMGAGTISRWNKASPSLDKIVSIAGYFKISIDQLAGYAVDEDIKAKLDEKNLKIIDYLRQKTIRNEDDNNFWKDYETQIRLYLVPNNDHPLPMLECSDKAALRDLYIAVV